MSIVLSGRWVACIFFRLSHLVGEAAADPNHHQGNIVAGCRRVGVHLAKRRSLYLLEVQTVRELSNDIKAMEKVGFEVKCTFEDYHMLPDGDLRDIVHMMLRLRALEGEF